MRPLIERTLGASVALVVLLAPVAPGYAGDRKLEVLLVDITPQEVSSDASRRCVEVVRSAFPQDYVHVRPMGQGRARELVGASTSARPFLTSGAETKPARFESEDRWGDTLLVIDCRPGANTVDVLIATDDGSTAALWLRGLSLTKARLEWLAAEILRHAWVGFNV